MIIAEIKSDERICEVFNSYKWVEIKFNDLKYGNIFRMFESDTKYPVEDEAGNHQFIARSDAGEKDGLFFIECLPLIPIKDKD